MFVTLAFRSVLATSTINAIDYIRIYMCIWWIIFIIMLTRFWWRRRGCLGLIRKKTMQEQSFAVAPYWIDYAARKRQLSYCRLFLCMRRIRTYRIKIGHIHRYGRTSVHSSNENVDFFESSKNRSENKGSNEKNTQSRQQQNHWDHKNDLVDCCIWRIFGSCPSKMTPLDLPHHRWRDSMIWKMVTLGTM